MKPLKNAEIQLREKLEGAGWRVTHRGWPDFACSKDGVMMFIEVKNYRGEMLKKEQHYILTQLAKLGLNCYKWTPDYGFEKITPATPAPVIEKKRRGKHLTYGEKLAKLSLEEQERIKEQGLYI